MCNAYLKCLVPKEVDLIKLLFYVLQAECLVPALRKDIKADLPPYGVCESQITEFLFENPYKLFPAKLSISKYAKQWQEGGHKRDDKVASSCTWP